MPKRSTTHWWSQNFLANRDLARRMVTLARIRRDDVAYDLGAGGGTLTAELAERAALVVAIERDPRLAQLLRSRFEQCGNVTVRERDMLSYPFPKSEYVVVANPPFDLTAELVRRLTEAEDPPRDAYLVLQTEAALRFMGRPRMTLAALLTAPWFSVLVLHRFRRSDFVPAPSVDTVFVRLHKRGPPLVPISQRALYRDFVVSVFTTWRPSLGASLASLFGSSVASRLLLRARVARETRPSHLPLQIWLRLFEEFLALPLRSRTPVAGAYAQLRRRQRSLAKIHRTRVPRDALGAA